MIGIIIGIILFVLPFIIFTILIIVNDGFEGLMVWMSSIIITVVISICIIYGLYLAMPFL